MIEFRNVTFRYPGSHVNVLDRLTLTIPGTGVTAIMGANGSGKSTAALCMNGILTPTSGDVIVDSVSTRDQRSGSQLRRMVGVVFQDPNLQFTSMTVEREIAFGLENINTPVAEMHEAVDQIVRSFDLGMFRKEAPASLSGGEKQRLALASVAVLRPRYLVLDEATTLLSPAGRRNILRYAISDAAVRKSALVLITQYPGEAQSANRVIVLHGGEVALQGEPSILLDEAPGLMKIGVPVPLRARLAADEC